VVEIQKRKVGLPATVVSGGKLATSWRALWSKYLVNLLRATRTQSAQVGANPNAAKCEPTTLEQEENALKVFLSNETDSGSPFKVENQHNLSSPHFLKDQKRCSDSLDDYFNLTKCYL
jgi:hypothetical protein